VYLLNATESTQLFQAQHRTLIVGMNLLLGADLNIAQGCVTVNAIINTPETEVEKLTIAAKHHGEASGETMHVRRLRLKVRGPEGLSAQQLHAVWGPKVQNAIAIALARELPLARGIKRKALSLRGYVYLTFANAQGHRVEGRFRVDSTQLRTGDPLKVSVH
jgi:hypothetical protein